MAWSPEGKGLTSWLLFVMFIVIVLLSRLVSRDRCGTCFYRFLILAIFLTSISHASCLHAFVDDLDQQCLSCRICLNYRLGLKEGPSPPKILVLSSRLMMSKQRRINVDMTSRRYYHYFIFRHFTLISSFKFIEHVNMRL